MRTALVEHGLILWIQDVGVRLAALGANFVDGHNPSALTSAESVRRKTQARVSALLSRVKAPSFWTEKSLCAMPVRRANRAASACVMGIVVSLQHAEQPLGMHGRERAMGNPSHPPSSRRGGLSGGCRAIRVVWISFRPSEPETGVRILHRPPQFTWLNPCTVGFSQTNDGVPRTSQPAFIIRRSLL